MHIQQGLVSTFVDLATVSVINWFVFTHVINDTDKTLEIKKGTQTALILKFQI